MLQPIILKKRTRNEALMNIYVKGSKVGGAISDALGYPLGAGNCRWLGVGGVAVGVVGKKIKRKHDENNSLVTDRGIGQQDKDNRIGV